MDKKQALIKQCRYYSGQDAPPFDDPKMDWFWEVEQRYVASNGVLIGEHEYYKNIGGKTYPGIPYPILIGMFTSWGKQIYNIKDSISDFYSLMEEYLSIASDHCPKDRIPGQ